MAVVVTVTVSGYDYGFDFEAERIDVDATLDVITVENVYEAVKEAQAHESGIVYPKIATAEGKTNLGGADSTFITVILLRSWVINSLKSSGVVTIREGNLVRSDGELIIQENPLITYVNQLSQAGVLVESGTSGLTSEESAVLSSLLTTARFKSLFFKRDNAIDAEGLITSYVAGDPTEEEVTVTVAYDDDGVPESETPS